MHEYTGMYDERYACKYVYVYLRIHTWKADGRKTKQLKLLRHLHSQFSVCQKGHHYWPHSKNYSTSGQSSKGSCVTANQHFGGSFCDIQESTFP